MHVHAKATGVEVGGQLVGVSSLPTRGFWGLGLSHTALSCAAVFPAGLQCSCVHVAEAVATERGRFWMTVVFLNISTHSCVLLQCFSCTHSFLLLAGHDDLKWKTKPEYVLTAILQHVCVLGLDCVGRFDCESCCCHCWIGFHFVKTESSEVWLWYWDRIPQ